MLKEYKDGLLTITFENSDKVSSPEKTRKVKRISKNKTTTYYLSDIDYSYYTEYILNMKYEKGELHRNLYNEKLKLIHSKRNFLENNTMTNSSYRSSTFSTADCDMLNSDPSGILFSDYKLQDSASFIFLVDLGNTLGFTSGRPSLSMENLEKYMKFVTAVKNGVVQHPTLGLQASIVYDSPKFNSDISLLYRKCSTQVGKGKYMPTFKEICYT